MLSPILIVHAFCKGQQFSSSSTHREMSRAASELLFERVHVIQVDVGVS